MSKPRINSKTTLAELHERLNKLEDDNTVLRALLAHTDAKLKAASIEAIAPAAPAALRLSEEELWNWCLSFWQESGGEEWAIDGLMLLLWNVAHQKRLTDSVDLADRLISKLYALTINCESHATDYLHNLPGKNYQPEEETEVPDLANAA